MNKNKTKKTKEKELYRYKDLSTEAKEKALKEVFNTHIFDRDYILAKQTGEYSSHDKKGYYKFLLELEEDTFWYRKNGKIALKTNPLILDGNELSINNLTNDEETYNAGSTTYQYAKEYANSYGYTSWKKLLEDFEKQKKALKLKGKIQIRKINKGFELKVFKNFTYDYWRKHA